MGKDQIQEQLSGTASLSKRERPLGAVKAGPERTYRRGSSEAGFTRAEASTRYVQGRVVLSAHHKKARGLNGATKHGG